MYGTHRIKKGEPGLNAIFIHAWGAIWGIRILLGVRAQVIAILADRA